MRITAVTCVKNEGPFLVEWIAFNRLIGVTDFLFYSNDCTDGTDGILDRLQQMGIVVHLPNPAVTRKYQMEALKDSRQQSVVRSADWIWIADVDEFLNIRVGNGTIPDLISACANPKAISVHFQFFANNGIETYEDRPVIEQFVRSHDPEIWGGDASQEVKTLVRADFPVKYYGAHRPFLRQNVDPARHPAWTDGSGRAVPEKFQLAEEKQWMRKFPAKGARDFATLNHYALRSLDSYLVKNDRGDVNREHRSFDRSYWDERNDASHEDPSIQTYLPALREEMARLLADPQLRTLHDAAVKAHRERRDKLLELPHYRDLRDQLRNR